MVLFEKLIQLLETVNPEYFYTYEEKSLMNVIVDKLTRKQPYAYIEEFRSGKYTKQKYWRGKQTKIQIWFCRATNFQNDAIEREKQRVQIEKEVVIPFIEAYEASNLFGTVDSWEWATPPSRFDENEVSIMLQFTLQELNCNFTSNEIEEDGQAG